MLHDLLDAAFLLASRDTTDLDALAWGDRNGVALDRLDSLISPRDVAVLVCGGFVPLAIGCSYLFTWTPAPTAPLAATGPAPTAPPAATAVPVLPAAVLRKQYANTAVDIVLPGDLRDVSSILTRNDQIVDGGLDDAELTDDGRTLEVSFDIEDPGGFQMRCDTTGDGRDFFVGLDDGRADLPLDAGSYSINCSRRSTTVWIHDDCGVGSCTLSIPVLAAPSQARIVISVPDGGPAARGEPVLSPSSYYP